MQSGEAEALALVRQDIVEALYVSAGVMVEWSMECSMELRKNKTFSIVISDPTV